MIKIPLEQFNEQLVDSSYILIIGLGFDPRCLTVLSNFNLEKISHVLGVSNAGWYDSNSENISRFKEIVGEKGAVYGEKAESILEVVDAVKQSIRESILDNSLPVVLDITSMSHELLAVLLGLLNDLKILDRIMLVYVGASEYSFNSRDGNIWLSRGVKNVRSVLGFPGDMLPSKKLHLVVMAGFESERAAHAIVSYEPASVSIGLGRKEHSVSEEHHSKNKMFFDQLNAFVSEQKLYSENVHQFSFSCVDPWQAKNDLLNHIGSLQSLVQKNIVICPLNTKLSTVGAVLAVLERPEIQLCYLEPIEYNTEGYAMPGKEVTLIRMETIG